MTIEKKWMKYIADITVGKNVIRRTVSRKRRSLFDQEEKQTEFLLSTLLANWNMGKCNKIEHQLTPTSGVVMSSASHLKMCYCFSFYIDVRARTPWEWTWAFLHIVYLYELNYDTIYTAPRCYSLCFFVVCRFYLCFFHIFFFHLIRLFIIQFKSDCPLKQRLIVWKSERVRSIIDTRSRCKQRNDERDKQWTKNKM